MGLCAVSGCSKDVSSRRAELAGPPSPFAVCFNSPEHSDVVLHLKPDAPSPRSDSSAAASTHMARSYSSHAIILAVQSGFFKALLSPAAEPGNHQSTSPAPVPRRIDIPVAAEELDPFHELLRMFYSQTLPAVSTADPAYLRCMKLADRFKAASCLELLTAGLAAAPVEDIDCAVLNFVYRAPQQIALSRSFPAVLDLCSKAVVRLFGDVPAVIRDETLLQQFRALPHAAVLAWIQSDELQVHSENCVVFLATAWVKANQATPAAQLEELAHRIRVFHLGPAYLHHVIPALGWFKGCSYMEYLPAVLSCIRAGITMSQGLEAERDKMCGDFKWPEGWCAKPRQRSNSTRTDSWVVSPSLIIGGTPRQLVTPTPFYINGFLMSMLMEEPTSPTATAPAPSNTLGIFVSVNRAAMSALGLPWPARAVFRFENISIKMSSAGSEKCKEGALLGARLFTTMHSWGLSNFLNTTAELLAPYVQDGQLHIDVTFSAVDT